MIKIIMQTQWRRRRKKGKNRGDRYSSPVFYIYIRGRHPIAPAASLSLFLYKSNNALQYKSFELESDDEMTERGSIALPQISSQSLR